MKKNCIAVFIAFLMLVATLGQAQSGKKQAVIFDSDMGPDYDDVGAIAMLHAFADSGYIDILATISSTKYAGVAGVFSVLNTYFNRPHLPIGIPKKNGLELRDVQHWSDSLLANYPHNVKSNDDVPDATDLYRKVLAAQPDGSVTIITVGFFTNMANLLQSQPDQYSRLGGKELVQKKVKSLVSMAGRFPSGKEFNVDRDPKASQLVFTQWPTPILLSRFEIGMKIKVGLPLIANSNIAKSPVKDVFRISIPLAKEDSAGRMSWDETAVLVAVKGHEQYYSLEKGRMIVADDGSNTWQSGGNHLRLIEKASVETVKAEIEKLIQHQPLVKK